MTSSATVGGAAPRAVLAGHGDFATGLASAVAQITGVSDAFALITNRDLSGDEILAALRDAVDARGVRVIFTDLPAGSCTFAARRLVRERPDVTLVTGVNLPTLLDFVFASDASAVGDAVEKGRSALAMMTGGSGGASSGPASGARGAA
jgi:mannose/fructose-specific phosphotransferase system component IIA